MDINFLRERQKGIQESKLRKLHDSLSMLFFPFTLLLVGLFYLLMNVAPFFRRYDCLYINCKAEQSADVVTRLRKVLDFRDEPRTYKKEIELGPNHTPIYSVVISDPQISEQRVPGPLFSGSPRALHWLADKLRDVNIDCRVGRCSEKTSFTLYHFRHPRWPTYSLAEAFEENRQRNVEEVIGQVSGRTILT